MKEDTLSSVADYWVYILCCGDGSLYTGITRDVEKRLAAHQRGRGGKYTRSHLPVSLAYKEFCGSHSDALRRELAIKALCRADKLSLIAAGENKT